MLTSSRPLSLCSLLSFLQVSISMNDDGCSLSVHVGEGCSGIVEGKSSLARQPLLRKERERVW